MATYFGRCGQDAGRFPHLSPQTQPAVPGGLSTETLDFAIFPRKGRAQLSVASEIDDGFMGRCWGESAIPIGSMRTR